MRCLKSLMSALSQRCSAVGAVVGHFGTSAEMSGPKDGSVRTYMVRTVSASGPNCLGAEMSCCRARHFGTSAELSTTLRHWCTEVSWVRCVRKALGGVLPSCVDCSRPRRWRHSSTVCVVVHMKDKCLINRKLGR